MNAKERKISNLIISLKQLKGVGNKTIIKILVDYKDLIVNTPDYDMEFLKKLNLKTINNGLEKTNLIWSEIQQKSDDIIEFVDDNNIKIIHPYMKEYPQRLLANKNFPPILYGKGDISLLNEQKIVAIIGTREPSEFGSKMGLRLSEILSKDDYVIVSGLAVGCDTIAHQGALNETGKTIAVLPTPIDAPVYPKDNQKLADTIAEKGGLLLSEYAPKSLLKGRELVNNLVARDEWQAGLSDGVIVIETSINGGSNHAIKHAINTNTPVGIFDYSNRLGKVFYEDERYGGNVNYLQNKQAHAIFFPETIEQFKSIMKSYNDNLKTIKFNLLEKDKELIQPKLF